MPFEFPQSGLAMPKDNVSSSDDLDMFELAPVSLWLEDYRELRLLFEGWRRDGVSDLRAHLQQNPDLIKTCSSCIRLIRVNKRTLTLLGANHFNHLKDNLDLIFQGEMLPSHVDELEQLWNGKREFSSHTVNYTLSGQRLDVQLSGLVLPGHEEQWDRVLVAIEDVTARETARRALAASENFAHGLFQHSPISLWVEDFSRIKLLLDGLRERGISDLRVFMDVHPDFIERCLSEIRVIDVNEHTLRLFVSPDKQTLLRRVGDIFRADMLPHFRGQLVDLWEGKLFQQREVVNYALDGTQLHVHLQFSVLPGHEDDWSLVQLALTDITARKKAEEYLEYLGQHDELTKLFNRSFYADELNRLERKGPYPVTIIVADVNGLKATNDELGHLAGDGLLRRSGEVLSKLIDKPAHVARIGGDEFAILLPGAEEKEGEVLVEKLQQLVDINNQFYPGPPLSFSVGIACSQPGERLESVVRRADMQMYEAKRAFYAAQSRPPAG